MFGDGGLAALAPCLGWFFGATRAPAVAGFASCLAAVGEAGDVFWGEAGVGFFGVVVAVCLTGATLDVTPLPFCTFAKGRVWGLVVVAFVVGVLGDGIAGFDRGFWATLGEPDLLVVEMVEAFPVGSETTVDARLERGAGVFLDVGGATDEARLGNDTLGAFLIGIDATEGAEVLALPNVEGAIVEPDMVEALLTVALEAASFCKLAALMGV